MVIIDHENYGELTEFDTIAEAQAAIRDCGPEFAGVELDEHWDGTVREVRTGKIVGYVTAVNTEYALCRLEDQLRRVTGDRGVCCTADDHGWVLVGISDPATGSGTTCGRWRDADDIAAELSLLPDWAGHTDNWDALGIPEFEDRA